MKFFVLVTNYPQAFERCLSTLPLQDTVVVINTLDKQAESALAEICANKDIPYTITQSNGTPGKGKNSLIKAFLDSGEQYGVFIDGDDYLTPFGVQYFQTIIDPPDMLCTYGDIRGEQPDNILEQLTKHPSLSFVDPAIWRFENEDPNPEVIPENVTLHFIKDKRFSYEESLEIGFNYADFTHYMKDYGDGVGLCRLLMWSRKAALLAGQYDEEVYIGDDQLQYLHFKQLAYKGELDMRLIEHRRKPLYVYVIDWDNSPGVCHEHHFANMRWLPPILERFDKRNDVEHFRLPFYDHPTQPQ